MQNQTVLILDFGGQYKELIARRVRECYVYSIIKPCDITIEEIKAINPIGIVFTGGPASVYLDDSPKCDIRILELGIPILGICYGMQIITHMLGGSVRPCAKSEYGVYSLFKTAESKLFDGIPGDTQVLMSHTDRVVSLPAGFETVSHTDQCENAAIENVESGIYCVQFHPEVENTVRGKDILYNFLYKICGARGDYTMDDYLTKQISAVRERIGNKRVLLAISGGVDSSVCAALLSEAIPGQLICIYIDHGFMRKNETADVKAALQKRNLHFVHVDARDRFLARLKGVEDPEKKRKLIGEEFVKCFEDESKKFGNIEFLAQGTIYPDIVESGKNKSAVIKSHHNVGGLPEDIGFEGIIEPLSGLFKDEVRKLGRMLRLPSKLINRQPFPGPGLAIRIIGEVTYEKLEVLREADAILREEIGRCREKPDQYFVVLTNTRSVGVMGDFRTYEYTAAIRAVRTNDFMTCEYAKLPYAVLSRLSSRITGEVRGINRIVYDITGKPPATIEWE